MKLSYKLFGAFLLTSLTIVVLLAGTMQFFVYRNFTDYITRGELDRLDDIVNFLAREYRTEKSWIPLKEKPGRWQREIHMYLLKTYGGRDRQPPPLHPLPERAQRDAGRPVHRPFPLPGEGRPAEQLGGGKRPAEDLPLPLPEAPKDPLMLGPRLALFDAAKHLVIGRNESGDKHTLREISIDGKTVGWLGLKTAEAVRHPLDLDFLKRQNRAFYLIGSAILVLAALMSLKMSRHLLAPVRQLAKGTRALASFQFDTEIEVSSEDELGQLGNDFNRMAKTLKHYETMRRQWISDISHELRTPLAVLRAEIEAMQDGIRKTDAATLHSLNAEVIRISKLVDDLHQLSLADSQNFHFKKELIYPVLILKKSLSLFAPQFDQQEILLQAELPDAASCRIKGDADRLTQLFSNLLENTLRYTDSPGKLKISAKADEKRLTLLFEDSAPGVPDADLNRIFDRLFRVDKSRSRALGGSGLGLSICRQIAEHHKGHISAFHSSADGLMIRVVLPLFLG